MGTGLKLLNKTPVSVGQSKTAYPPFQFNAGQSVTVPGSSRTEFCLIGGRGLIKPEWAKFEIRKFWV
jgi:hypothetical protein